MTPVQAHLLCVALVAADLLARAWRIQWIVQGLGHRISLRESVVLNAFGDAACAVTPLRLGGEPARLAGMLRSRVPAPAAFVAISLEVLAAWPVIIVAAGWLAWQHAPAWWEVAGSRLAASAVSGWPWVLAVVVVSVLAWRTT
ncbi:MAG: flippase-like domain-containing protein, partial [Gemmatimonadota bacterium]|nr:flippase-like domain-containing protein [Gemmatimonadota bacterium]